LKKNFTLAEKNFTGFAGTDGHFTNGASLSWLEDSIMIYHTFLY